jgi:UDP-2-acetamido-3-amino-2,3-dideoxy-glucuronate N-acetyltransferase
LIISNPYQNFLNAFYDASANSQILKFSNSQIAWDMEFFAHPTSIIDDGCQIGTNSRIWHFSHIMAGAVVGENCIIGQNVFIANGVVVGNGVKIQNNVSLYTGVIVEDDVFLGPSMVFTNVMNPRSFIERKSEFRQTLIRKGATIGANATIICGNEIGEYAFVGAGAVVTKTIKPYALVLGNPARQTGWVSRNGLKLNFNNENTARCSETGETYILMNEKVSFKG